MMGFCDRATSFRALETAWDNGINFFDLARSYGYGQAESLFAKFARGKRDRVLIATKFGIEPDASPRANAIRLLRGGLGGIRHLRWKQPATTGRNDAFSERWSPARLRRGLHRSLRELGTEYVDVLYLHSPPAGITQRLDLFATLDRLSSEGLVRSYGLSTDAESATLALAPVKHTIGTVQHPYCPISGKTATLAQPPATVVLNHVLGGRGTLRGAATWINALRQNPDLPSETGRKLNAGEPAPILADILINGALNVARAQCVVVSMFSPNHIAANCKAIQEGSSFTAKELEFLMRALSGPSQPPAL
jgi:aryl-alcohol dehydrogenase-like predicted oxidoreductase